MSQEKESRQFVWFTHKRFGQLLLLATVIFIGYSASKDPGMRMMFGQTMKTADLLKDQIIEVKDAKERLKIVQSIPDDWRIKFDTQSKDPKGTIVAFVDPMCVNCRGLIAKTAEINQMGYSIDYIVAPLPGDDRVMAADSVTCAPTSERAMDLLNVAGDKHWSVPSNGCTNAARYSLIDKSILSQWNIKGRPYIVTPDGVGIQGNLNLGTLTQALAVAPSESR